MFTKRDMHTMCRLRDLGFEPRIKDAAGLEQFPFVAFAAPPSGSPDYVAEVRNPHGVFLMHLQQSLFLFSILYHCEDIAGLSSNAMAALKMPAPLLCEGYCAGQHSIEIKAVADPSG